MPQILPSGNKSCFCDPGLSVLCHISNTFGHLPSSSFRLSLEHCVLFLVFVISALWVLSVLHKAKSQPCPPQCSVPHQCVSLHFVLSFPRRALSLSLAATGLSFQPGYLWSHFSWFTWTSGTMIFPTSLHLGEATCDYRLCHCSHITHSLWHVFWDLQVIHCRQHTTHLPSVPRCLCCAFSPLFLVQGPFKLWYGTDPLGCY